MNIIVANPSYGLCFVLLAIPAQHGKWISTHPAIADTLWWERLLPDRAHTEAALGAIDGVVRAQMDVVRLKVTTGHEISLENPIAHTVMGTLRVLLGGDHSPDPVHFWAAEVTDAHQWLIGQHLNVPSLSR